MRRKYFLPVIFLYGILLIGSCAITTDDESDDIAKYIGTWNVNDQPARLNYTVTIVANPSNTAEILLNNFADLGSTAVGLVVGKSVVIDNQSLSSEYSVNGIGSFVNNTKLEFNFELNDGIDIESRIAIFSK
ncbi:MAG: hypothetical protein ISR56_10515 [Bacteroidales bacterium]|nr:hypothetical protein [Bacteroidales bacterium]